MLERRAPIDMRESSRGFVPNYGSDIVQLVGIAGSLRRASYNRGLLLAARELAPEGTDVSVLSIHDVPLYDSDLEADSGVPESVAVIKEAVAAADGLLIATPEYNSGIPGVLKNVMDWLSRPPSDQARVLHGKSVALMGATPGRMGTTLAQAAWLPVLRSLRMRLWMNAGSFYVSAASTSFDEAGALTDSDLRSRLEAYLAAYATDLRKLLPEEP